MTGSFFDTSMTLSCVRNLVRATRHTIGWLPKTVVVYWHVDDAQAAVDRLVSLGARVLEAPRDFGEGFIGASVIDPFGNILVVMRNPHYLEVLAGRTKPGTEGGCTT